MGESAPPVILIEAAKIGVELYRTSNWIELFIMLASVFSLFSLVNPILTS